MTRETSAQRVSGNVFPVSVVALRLADSPEGEPEDAQTPKKYLCGGESVCVASWRQLTSLSLGRARACV